MLAPIVINWYGPFDPYDIDKSYGSSGIYILTGREKRKRDTKILYCGITKAKFTNYIKNHPRLNEIFSKQNAWIGTIIHPNSQKKRHREHAEWIIIYYCKNYYNQLDLNDKKTKSPPPETGIVISHWFNRRGTARIKQPHPIRNLPDVICWDEELWRTSNLKVERE
jgi:hypothetical protein